MTTAASPALITVTLGAFKLPAFNIPWEVDGQTIQLAVPAGIQIPAGVQGTFPMPSASINFTVDSSATVDSSTENSSQ